MGDNRGAVGMKEYDVQSIGYAIGYAKTIIQRSYSGRGWILSSG